MRLVRFIVIGFLCAGVAWIIFGVVVPTYLVYHSFDQLEEKAKRVITPMELQIWATNLLANPPMTDHPTVSDLGTNFPRQLLSLYRREPYISIRPETKDSPGSIFLMWGGGVIGHCGFEAGPTNFPGFRGSKPWQGHDGVYFWSDQQR